MYLIEDDVAQSKVKKRTCNWISYSLVIVPAVLLLISLVVVVAIVATSRRNEEEGVAPGPPPRERQIAMLVRWHRLKSSWHEGTYVVAFNVSNADDKGVVELYVDNGPGDRTQALAPLHAQSDGILRTRVFGEGETRLYDRCQGDCRANDDLCGVGLMCYDGQDAVRKPNDVTSYDRVPGCDASSKPIGWTSYCVRPRDTSPDLSLSRCTPRYVPPEHVRTEEDPRTFPTNYTSATLCAGLYAERDRTFTADTVWITDAKMEDDRLTLVIRLPEVGGVVMQSISVTVDAYRELVFDDARWTERENTADVAKCAYVGSATAVQNVIVSGFTCGAAGPSFDVVFQNGTRLRLDKNSYLEHVDGAYEATLVTPTDDADRIIDDVFNVFAHDTRNRASARNLDDTSNATVLYFDYVMVSDWKRYDHYGGVDAVATDTLREIAVVNAMYLIGDRFTPQIQFRVLDQIVFTSRPSSFTASNTEAGPYDSTGYPSTRIDATVLLKDFWNWVFFNSEYARDGTQITGHMKYLGDEAFGWHLLTGFMIASNNFVGMANGMPCAYSLDVTDRAGCESVLSGADDPSYWHPDGYFQGTASCYPRTSMGWTSTVNSFTQRGAGLILAHEFGHNLGFGHTDGLACGLDATSPVMNSFTRPYGLQTWSECSVNEFNANRLDGGYSCAAWSDRPKLAATQKADAYDGNHFGLDSPNYGAEHHHHVPVNYTFVLTALPHRGDGVSVTGVRARSGTTHVPLRGEDVTPKNGFEKNDGNVAMDDDAGYFLSKATSANDVGAAMFEMRAYPLDNITEIDVRYAFSDAVPGVRILRDGVVVYEEANAAHVNNGMPNYDKTYALSSANGVVSYPSAPDSPPPHPPGTCATLGGCAVTPSDYDLVDDPPAGIDLHAPKAFKADHLLRGLEKYDRVIADRHTYTAGYTMYNPYDGRYFLAYAPEFLKLQGRLRAFWDDGSSAPVHVAFEDGDVGPEGIFEASLRRGVVTMKHQKMPWSVWFSKYRVPKNKPKEFIAPHDSDTARDALDDHWADLRANHGFQTPYPRDGVKTWNFNASMAFTRRIDCEHFLRENDVYVRMQGYEFLSSGDVYETQGYGSYVKVEYDSVEDACEEVDIFRGVKLLAEENSENFGIYGQSVSISGDYAIVGKPGGRVGFNSSSAYVYKRDGFSWTLQTILVADDGEIGDVFGWSVSISGDYAIVGAYQDVDEGVQVGSAYVYKRDGTSWKIHAKLLAGDGVGGGSFGFAVSISGNYAIVGAMGDDDKGFKSGSAYVFEREGILWTKRAKLVADDGANFQFFGMSVSISGDYAIVGVPLSRSAYVYERDGISWTQHSKLVPYDEQTTDFGLSVSISGNDAIVGAAGGLGSGSAYVYERQEKSWANHPKLVPSDRKLGDRFGSSVSVSGDYVIVGATGPPDLGSGSAYVFRRAGSSWSQQPTLNPDDGDEDDDFGHSVSISGNYAIVGAPRDTVESGSVYVYRREM